MICFLVTVTARVVISILVKNKLHAFSAWFAKPMGMSACPGVEILIMRKAVTPSRLETQGGRDQLDSHHFPKKINLTRSGTRA